MTAVLIYYYPNEDSTKRHSSIIVNYLGAPHLPLISYSVTTALPSQVYQDQVSLS